ncbi:MAG: GNAT family N-acetyltransferase [Candidatus Dormibacteria bacterium]
MAAIRRLIEAEAASFRDLRLRALRDSPEAFGSSYERELGFSAAEWQRRVTALATGTDRALFVAEVDGSWVGMAGILADAARAEIWGMWVAPEVRRRGVGNALLHAAVEFATLLGQRDLRLEVTAVNATARALYQRFGFVETGDSRSLERNPDAVAIIMEMTASGSRRPASS